MCMKEVFRAQIFGEYTSYILLRRCSGAALEGVTPGSYWEAGRSGCIVSLDSSDALRGEAVL